ncbi:MAG TPA: hypothetical protein VE242_13070 [Chthoniobacterales bacterium]|nr:hypothetical protein [Chthoniobacterales bacterium]
MTTTFRTQPLSHHRRTRSAAVSLIPADNRRPMEIDEATREFALEQAIRKATAQLRRSVKLPNPPEDGLYSPLSGRRVSPSVGRLFSGPISRCHQRI